MIGTIEILSSAIPNPNFLIYSEDVRSGKRIKVDDVLELLDDGILFELLLAGGIEKGRYLMIYSHYDCDQDDFDKVHEYLYNKFKINAFFKYREHGIKIV